MKNDGRKVRPKPSAGPDPRHSLTQLEVRYAETDQMGFAHHSVYAVWFELGRVRWLRRAGFCYGQLEKEGILLPVASLCVRFQRPGRFQDQITVECWPKEVGRSRLVFGGRAWRLAADEKQNELLAEAEVELACVDGDGRIRRLPDVLRDKAVAEMETRS
jgi:acyl-CoA thioester hydrolase